jgi:hypothetical protein
MQTHSWHVGERNEDNGILVVKLSSRGTAATPAAVARLAASNCRAPAFIWIAVLH